MELPLTIRPAKVVVNYTSNAANYIFNSLSGKLKL